VNILDYQNNINAIKLIGHTDYSFAAAFNPEKPWELATGNQDTTAIVWDIRNP
jgi:WD40 repeat protein